MGIKISALPHNVLPYTGSEEIPLVQDRETRAGTLSSFVNYLSGDFAFVNRTNEFTRSQSISGDLTVTGEISATAFYASSAHFSIIDIKQYELSGFDVTGDVSLTGNLSAQGDLFIDGAGIIDTSTGTDALRITQRGEGMALRVEDAANIDFTPFVITASGSVGIGTDSPNFELSISGSASATGDLIVDGYTGLGTEAPNEKLTVIGRISSTDGFTTTGTGIIDTSSSTSALRITQRGSGPALFVEDSASTDSTPFIITSGGDVGIGTATPNEKLTVIGDISATQVIFANELDFGSPERPSFTGIKQALNSFLYVSPALSYMRVNGSSSVILEVGQALVAPPITWTSNKVEAPAISGYRLTLPNGSVQAGSLTYTFSSYSDPNTYDINTIPGTTTQATSSWTVTVTDWNNVSNTATATAYWRYRVYFGATNQTSPTDTIVRTSADDSVLSQSRTGLGAKTITASNEYLYVAYPQRFGTTSALRVNGFNFTDFTQVDIATFTNSQGGTDSYYVYRSNNLLTGSYTVEII